MITTDLAPSIRREATNSLRWLLVAACLVSLTLPAGAQAVSPLGEPGQTVAEEWAWITMAADAFEAVQQREELIAESVPLAKLGEAPGVVLTRVRSADLDAVSALLHERFRRCPGFVYHPTLAHGHRALASIANPPVREPQAYTIDEPELVSRLTAAIAKPVVLDTIERLSTDFNNRYHAHPSGTAAAEWIRDRWQGYAALRPDVTVELYDHNSTNQPSVILTIPGTLIPEEVVVLGGHLDSIAPGTGNPNFIGPGADDDASGIAVLSEVIRVAMVQNFLPQRTVVFMAYAAEEIGLVGSDEIAAQYAADGIDVVAVLQLDMTDYFGSTEDIGLINDFTEPALTIFLGELLGAYQPDLVWTLTACGYGCSDHRSWNQRGYSAAFPFEAKFVDRNPFIHTVDDTLATLGNSVDHAAKFVRLGVAFMVEIAKDGDVDIFEDGFESGDTTAWSVTIP